MPPQLRAWLAAFIFTQLVEVPIYWRGVPCSLLVAFGASAITHPIVWFGFFTTLVRAAYLTRVVCAELFAWLTEAVYLLVAAAPRGPRPSSPRRRSFFRLVVRGPAGSRRVTLLRALAWSAIANASSLGLGLLSRHLFGAP